MATRYFLDVNPLYRDVAGLRSEVYTVDNGNAFGVLATDDPEKAERIAATPGISELTKEQYEERLKKKAASMPPPPPLNLPSLRGLEPAAIKGAGAVVVEGERKLDGSNPPTDELKADELIAELIGGETTGKAQTE